MSDPTEPEHASAPSPTDPAAENVALPSLEPAEPPTPPSGSGPEATPPRDARPSRRRIPWRGLGITAAGLVPLFALMALESSVPRGPLWGVLSTLVLTIGVLDLLGLFSPSTAELEAATPWRDSWLGSLPFSRLTAASSSGSEGATSTDTRDGGREPLFVTPVVTLPVGFALIVLGAVFASWQALPWVIIVALLVQLPGAVRRPGLLVFTMTSLLTLPFLGAFGLVDPWETHYGEVAREILSRGDWISLWWAHEEWFFSKPIFIFWSEALSMGAFGVHYLPDQMLSPSPELAHPEWAVRFPHYVLSTTAICMVYLAIARNFGRRAGALSALCLATMPYFYLLAHQAITDMPFVSTMTIAMSFMLIAIHADQQALRGVRIGDVVLTAKHAVLGGLVALSLPQSLYLFTRNVRLVPGGFMWDWDRFEFGSGGGNAGNPGQPPLRDVTPAIDSLFAQPAAQGLYWLIGLIVLLVMLRKETRLRPLAMVGFYIFAALSTMAKGIPGFALPGMIAFFFLLGSKRWSLLLDGSFKIAQGILIVLVVGFPWYVAVYMRHGQAFTDRFLIHDHINRLTAGVHGDTGSIEYFFEQLGFGLFPWIAIVPLAVGTWAFYQRRKDASAQDLAKADAAMFVGLWGTSAFVLFSAMTTKFHHYIFPAVPPAGILVGLAIEPMWAQVTTDARRNVLGTVAAFLAPLPMALGVGGLQGNLRGMAPEGLEGAALTSWVMQHPEPRALCYAGIALGIGLFVFAWRSLRPNPGEKPAFSEASPVGMTTAFGIPALPAASMGLVASAVLVGLVGRDFSWLPSESHPFGYERLVHLFCYNYERAWPQELDYRPILTGFAVTAGIAFGLSTLATLRATALRVAMGLAFCFGGWALDVYLVDLAPHWGMRRLFDIYYGRRTGDEERVLAWQLNWKGENFYTGNAVYIFEDMDTTNLVHWAEEHQGQRHWVVLEPSRVGALRSTLRNTEVVRESTPRDDVHFAVVSMMVGMTGEDARRYRAAHGIPEPTEEQLR